MRKFPFQLFSSRRSGAGGISWLVAFLGNPGARYAGTRHNAGFMAADVAQRKTGTNIDRLKFKSLTAIAEMGGARVMLLKPQTFMNLSGDAVREAMGFYKLPLDRVVAVSDDFTLALGALRVRRSGSSGGHNGLRDIISKCGGEGFPRVRIGVGAPPESAVDAAEWVLSRFDGADKDVIGGAAERAVGAIEMIISSGVDSAMNAFNRN